MAGPEHWISIGKRLNGHKRLVLGNHDQVQHIKTFTEAGFQKVQGAKELQIAGLRMLCTHYPVHESSLFKRDCNVHGHVHANPDITPKVSKEGQVKCWLNVCVERMHYRPVHIEDLAKLIKQRRSEALVMAADPMTISAD